MPADDRIPYEKIKQITDEYALKIKDNPEAKNEEFAYPASDLEIEGHSQLLRVYDALLRDTVDSFQKYAVIKFVFYLFIENYDIGWIKDYLIYWFSVCISVGAYKDCIVCTKACMDPEIWETFDSNLQVKILQYSAKSQRNLGYYTDAFNTYRLALRIAKESDNALEAGIVLLKIGKVYSNYLIQKSLSLGFLLEALNYFKICSTDDILCKKFTAICHDAIGQVKREWMPKEARKHFKKALEINGEIERNTGNIRANAHLILLEFNNAPPKKKKMLVEKMQDIIWELLSDDNNIIGAGVRWIELASMYYKMGEYDNACVCIDKGKNIAALYSDNKTLVRAMLLDAKMYRHDRERALAAIGEGKKTASRYSLMVYESQINEMEIEFHNYLFDQKLADIKTEQPVSLLKKNKIIYMELVNRVKESLQRINNADRSEDEFSFLTSKVTKGLKENVLFDYDDIINKLDQIIKNLIFELQKIEGKEQDLLVSSIMNSLARELLHDLKGLIPINSDVSRLDTIREILRRIAGCLVVEYKDHSKTNDNMEGLAKQINEQASELQNIDNSLKKIKKIIAKNINLPRDLKENFSMSSVCKNAVNEMNQIFPGFSERIVFEDLCKKDIVLKLNANLMSNIIGNLIRNAIDYLQKKGGDTSGEKIYVSLGHDVPATVYMEDMPKDGILSITTLFKSQAEAENVRRLIDRGLAAEYSSDEYSSGYGLETASRIFCQLMSGTVKSDSYEWMDGFNSGIRIKFPIEES